MAEMVIVNCKCRVCGNVPEKGFYKSQVDRKNYECPKCTISRVQDNRAEKKLANSLPISHLDLMKKWMN